MRISDYGFVKKVTSWKNFLSNSIENCQTFVSNFRMSGKDWNEFKQKILVRWEPSFPFDGFWFSKILRWNVQLFIADKFISSWRQFIKGNEYRRNEYTNKKWNFG